MRAVTVAPPGAPEWATDPDELWNRAEAAEKRKDAQVARDYRIPIPFGLTDEQAGDMAEAMARYLLQDAFSNLEDVAPTTTSPGADDAVPWSAPAGRLATLVVSDTLSIEPRPLLSKTQT